MIQQTTANVKAAWQVIVQEVLIEDARIDPVVSSFSLTNWIEFTLPNVGLTTKPGLIKDQLFSANSR